MFDMAKNRLRFSFYTLQKTLKAKFFSRATAFREQFMKEGSDLQ